MYLERVVHFTNSPMTMSVVRALPSTEDKVIAIIHHQYQLAKMSLFNRTVDRQTYPYKCSFSVLCPKCRSQSLLVPHQSHKTTQHACRQLHMLRAVVNSTISIAPICPMSKKLVTPPSSTLTYV